MQLGLRQAPFARSLRELSAARACIHITVDCSIPEPKKQLAMRATASALRMLGTRRDGNGTLDANVSALPTYLSPLEP